MFWIKPLILRLENTRQLLSEFLTQFEVWRIMYYTGSQRQFADIDQSWQISHMHKNSQIMHFWLRSWDKLRSMRHIVQKRNTNPVLIATKQVDKNTGKTSVKQSMWHQWLNFSFVTLWEYIFLCKENIYSTIFLPRVTSSTTLYNTQERIWRNLLR